MHIRTVSVLRATVLRTCLGLTACGLLVSACSDDGAASAEREAGKLSLPLTATSASGAVYRLRQAVFNVTDINTGFTITLFSEQDPLSSTLEAQLATGDYFVSLQGGWQLEKAVGNTLSLVEATLTSPAVQQVGIGANGESSVVFRFETSGEVVQFGQGHLVIDIEVDETGAGGSGGTGGSGGSAGSGGSGGGPGGVSFDGLIQTNTIALQNFTLRNTLDAAIVNAGRTSNADDAYHAIIDSYAPAFAAQDPSASHCDDQLAEFGGPGLNGYPLQCGRLESAQFNNLDTWFPIAAVNRLDLAAVDGSDCGQQRLVFANNNFIGNSRMLLIVEAEVPNPNPGCGIDACLPIAQFWADVDAETDPALRASMLSNAFLGAGIGGGFGPFVNADQLGPNGGQIRTNNFNDSPWTLREFHFDPGPFGRPRPAPVGDSPNGSLWNDFVPLSNGPLCRNAMASSLGGLLTDNVAAMSFVVPEVCKDAESRNDFSEDYVGQLLSGSGAFTAQLDGALAGTGLSAPDIAARARFAGSCIGCHQEASGLPLGRGVFAPLQFDFVHVNERQLLPCDSGDPGLCFGISDALRNVFLPHRAQVVSNFLASSPGCGVLPPFPGGPVLFEAAATSPSFAAAVGPEALAAPTGPARTLGGQLAGDHAH